MVWVMTLTIFGKPDSKNKPAIQGMNREVGTSFGFDILQKWLGMAGQGAIEAFNHDLL